MFLKITFIPVTVRSISWCLGGGQRKMFLPSMWILVIEIKLSILALIH